MPDERRTYEGRCHCGAIHFRVTSEPIADGVRCNCSICRRRNAVMSVEYYAAEDVELLSGSESLVVYRFAPHMVNHYFCRTCGIYPFHDAVEDPGCFRINLGCIDEIDLESLSVRLFDGRDSRTFVD